MRWVRGAKQSHSGTWRRASSKKAGQRRRLCGSADPQLTGGGGGGSGHDIDQLGSQGGGGGGLHRSSHRGGRGRGGGNGLLSLGHGGLGLRNPGGVASGLGLGQLLLSLGQVGLQLGGVHGLGLGQAAAAEQAAQLLSSSGKDARHVACSRARGSRRQVVGSAATRAAALRWRHSGRNLSCRQPAGQFKCKRLPGLSEAHRQRRRWPA